MMIEFKDRLSLYKKNMTGVKAETKLGYLYETLNNFGLNANANIDGPSIPARAAQWAKMGLSKPSEGWEINELISSSIDS